MTNPEEKVVAVIAPQKADGEDALAEQVSEIELLANSVVVTSDAEYEAAGDFGVKLKTKIGEVKDFFAPMKKSANEAHKKICAREKEMLSPLEKAEKTLKGVMGAYAAKKEADRRAAEEAARRLAQEEADRKLAMAVEAEASGDTGAASSAMLDAEIADSASRAVFVPSDKPKAKGVSVRKDYEIVSIDDSKVPDTLLGVLIRPVDTAAVKKLIKGSNGTIKIPGIVYRETSNVSFSRR